uniref:3-octaprenyl-4-hydroxybenzoate carboxy-lyase-like N-terminal domain-containing protein n=1 Tax=candidate division WOR-3 bacterium TaxID=2052148 RepID=A0A7C2K4V4_UNCW3
MDIDYLKKRVKEDKEEVDWYLEMGAITHENMDRKGSALLLGNIKDDE